MYYMDPSYVLVLIGALICMIASSNVNRTYSKYEKLRSQSGLTGAQAAERILQMSGVHGVQIRHVSGDLTDHFDPRSMTVNLSDATYGSTSIAAISVAAHECGHVMQHEKGYVPLKVRAALVPVANIGSNLGLPIVVLSLLLGLGYRIALIGVFMFSFGVLFQLVTLPVEFDASSRALRMLVDYGILGQDEVGAGRKVLRAAALTYVAALASSVLQLLRLLSIANRRRD